MPRPAAKPFTSSYLHESLSALREGVPQAASAAKDIAKGLLPFADPRPGLERLGDLATFLTGGLQSPIGPSGPAKVAGVMGPERTAPAITDASGRLAANEREATKLRNVLAEAAPGAGKDLVDRLADRFINIGVSAEGLLHSLTTGDWKGAAGGLGFVGARKLAQWWRDPARRLADLEKIIAKQKANLPPAEHIWDLPP